MSMIPESVFIPQTLDWKTALSQSFRRVEDLLNYCELESAIPEKIEHTHFPLKVTEYYASLIEKGNPQDPLLLQVLPVIAENIKTEGYGLDSVGDIPAMPVPGLIHKYSSRALLSLTGACPIHCRYCFRRHFPYNEAKLDLSLNSTAFNYLQQHTEIKEIILSGGDPLMLSDQRLSTIIEQLNQVPHIRYLRIHSRLLSVLPQRITTAFINTLAKFNGKLLLVTHINHPNEISSLNQTGFNRLSQRGFQLFNQSVLLKSINNNANILAELSYRLFDNNIVPYYIHSLDKVEGAAHFDIPADQQCIIYTQLRNKLPGYLVPQLVNEFSGQLSKTPVQCN